MNTRKNLHLNFQRLKTALFSSIKWVKRIISPRPKQRTLLPSNIYHHCNDLLLAAFIDCSVDRNYKSLIKYGHCKPYLLQQAWEQIYAEYSEKSGSNSYKLLMNLSRDIGYLESKRYCIAICLKVLQHRAEQRCIKILQDYGYKLPFDYSNPEKYAEDINQVAQRTGALTVAIEQKKLEIVQNTKKLNGKELTREHFDSMIAAISKHMGFRLDKNSTTVSEFISYRKNYEREMEALQRVNDKEHRPAVKGINHV